MIRKRRQGSRRRRVAFAGLMIGMAGVGGACHGTPPEAAAQEATGQASPGWTDARLSALVDRYAEGLDLSQDQEHAVQELFVGYRDGLGEPGTTWRVAADLQKILTSEQIAAIAARGSRPQAAGPPDGPGPERMGRGQFQGRSVAPPMGAGQRRRFDPGFVPGVAGLDLSDEQQAQLNEIREAHAAEMAEIRDGLRAGSLSRDSAEQRLASIRAEIHEAAQSVLTADQRAALEQHRAEAEARRSEAEARREQAQSLRQERWQAGQAARVESLGLTAEQEEIWILHDSLSRLFARQGAGRRAADGRARMGRGGTRGPAR